MDGEEKKGEDQEEEEEEEEEENRHSPTHTHTHTHTHTFTLTNGKLMCAHPPQFKWTPRPRTLTLSALSPHSAQHHPLLQSTK